MPGSSMDFLINLVFKQTGMAEIVSAAKQAMQQLQASGQATPGRVERIAGVAQSALQRRGEQQGWSTQVLNMQSGKLASKLAQAAEEVGVSGVNFRALASAADMERIARRAQAEALQAEATARRTRIKELRAVALPGETKVVKGAQAEIAQLHNIGGTGGMSPEVIRERQVKGLQDIVARTQRDVQALVPEGSTRASSTAMKRVAELLPLLAKEVGITEEYFKTVSMQAVAPPAAGTGPFLRGRKGELIEPDIAGRAQGADWKEQISDQVTLFRNKVPLGDMSPEQIAAKAGALRLIEASKARVAAIQALTAEETEQLVQERAAMAKVNAANRAREKAIIRQAIDSGELGGTFYQRVIGRARGQVPTEVPTLGQSITQKFATTAQYAVGGMAIFALRDMLKDAEAFEKALVVLRGQLDALGQGGQFDAMRTKIKDIAKDTGQSASDVATLASRMIGVFANPQRAIAETESAMKLMTVTGLSLNDAMQQLVPISRAFNVSIEQIGDSVLRTQEEFGVAPTAMLSFLSRVSATAESAGLSMRELEVIGAEMANSFGGSIDTAAEQFNRFLPQFDGLQEKLFAVLSTSKGAQPLMETLLGDFGRGETGKALNDLIAGYGQLSKAEQEALGPGIVRAIANPKQAAFIIQLLEASSDIAAKEKEAGTQTGELQHRFENLQATVGNAQQRVSETFSQIGSAIFESGVADVFTQAANGIQSLLSGLGAVLGVFGKLNEATKPLTQWAGFQEGLLGPLVEFVAVAALVAKGINLIVAARARETAETQGSTGAQVANDQSRRRVFTSEAAQTEGTVTHTAALRQDTAATIQDTEAQGANAGIRGTVGRAVTGTQGFLGRARTGVRGFASRATAGGRFIPEVAAEAEEGAGVGATSAGPIGLYIAGALAVKSARDQQAEELSKVGEGYRASLKNADMQQLQQIADTNFTLMDKLQSTFFGQDMPQTMAYGEMYARNAAAGMKDISGLVDSKQTDEFVKRLSGTQMEGLQNFFNQSQEAVGLAAQAGLKTERIKGSPGTAREVPTIDKKELAAALPKFKQMAEEHVAGADMLVKWVDDVLNGNQNMADLRQTVANAVQKGDIKKALEEGGVDQTIAETTKSLQEERAAGQITSGAYVQGMKEKLEWLQKEAEAAKTDPVKQADLRAKVAQGVAQVNQEQDKNLQARIDALARYDASSGKSGAQQAESNLARLVAAVPKLTSQQSRFDMLPKLEEASKAAFEKRVKAIADPVERAAAESQGWERTDVERAIDLEQQLSSTTGADQAALGNLATFLGTNSVELAKTLSETAIATGKTVQEVIKDDVKNMEEAVAKREGIFSEAYQKAVVAGNAILAMLGQGALGDVEALGKQGQEDPGTKAKNAASARAADFALRQAYASKDPIKSGQLKVQEATENLAALREQARAGTLEDANELKKAEADLVSANQGLADAYHSAAASSFDVQAALVARDPVASARVALAKARDAEASAVGTQAKNEARAATIAAQQHLEDAEIARQESRYGIQEAIDEKDPGKTAVHALEKAQRALANAHSEEERNQATADRIRAEHGLEDAIMAIFQSQVDLLTAIADAAGNTVESARLASQSAKDKLAVALAKGEDPNGANVNALRTDAVTKAAALRDATLADKEQHIEFLQQMGQMTNSQVIAAYTDLLQYPEATEKYKDQIRLKIHQLLQEAKADYQFNLPSNIQLPTFYEARRATQTPGGPGAYVDNRQVAVQINVNSAADLAKVETMIAQQLGTDRYVASGKRYGG